MTHSFVYDGKVEKKYRAGVFKYSRLFVQRDGFKQTRLFAQQVCFANIRWPK